MCRRRSVATWPSNWYGSPRLARSPAPAGWVVAIRTRPTAPPLMPCGERLAGSRWTVWSSSARAKRIRVSNLTVVILERRRNEDLIKEVRETGSRIKLISDGDVAGAMMTAIEGSGLDLLLGIGGSPEAVLAAAALKCLGGEIQCKLYARNPEEKEKAEASGADFDRVLGIDDLVRSDDVFFAATGVTDGEVLQGVKYHMNWAETESLVTRSRSGTLRRIYARHHWGYKQREWLGQPEEG